MSDILEIVRGLSDDELKRRIPLCQNRIAVWKERKNEMPEYADKIDEEIAWWLDHLSSIRLVMVERGL